MQTITFDIDGVKQLLAVTRAADRFRPTLEQFDALTRDGESTAGLGLQAVHDLDWSGIAPALWLVKDHGVYLLSNAVPPADVPLVAIYAQGCDPDEVGFHRSHQQAVRLMGKQNYCIALPLAEVERALAGSEGAHLDVLFDREQRVCHLQRASTLR